MLYIIGGAQRCGKTIVAKEIAQRLGASLISTDTIRGAFRATLRPSMLPDIFSWEDENKLAPADWVKRHSEQADELVRKLVREAEALTPAIRAFAETAGSRDVLLEGAHLLPTIVDTLPGDKKVYYVIDTSLDQFERICKYEPHMEHSQQYVRAWSVFNAAFARLIKTQCDQRGYQYVDLADTPFLEAQAIVRGAYVSDIL